MPNILKYLDLNQRVLKYRDIQGAEEAMDAGAVEFMGVRESPSSESSGKKKSKAKPRQIPIWEQLLMYCGSVIGVLFSSVVSQRDPLGSQISYVTLSSIVISLVVALAVIPLEFERLRIKSDTPLIVRFGLFVQSGVFWQVLLNFGKATVTNGL
jgi:hypothetical protein